MDYYARSRFSPLSLMLLHIEHMSLYYTYDQVESETNPNGLRFRSNHTLLQRI
jgi:hypothetical protein